MWIDDVRLGHAEDLGSDLHQRGRLAAADVGDAGPDQDRAVHLELHPRARPVVEPDDPPVGRERRREAPAHALAGRRGRAGRAEGVRGAAGGLGQPHGGLELLSRGQPLALPEVVPLADGERVQSEGAGQLVHLALVGERRLRRAEAPEGGGRRVVRQDRDAVDLDVGDAVRPRGVDHAVEEGQRRQVRVGARRRRCSSTSTATSVPSRRAPCLYRMTNGCRLVGEMIDSSRE